MLRIDNLTKRYGDLLVFQGLSQVFPPGCMALCEEDCTGKSTLLGIIAGLIQPDTGHVWIDGYSMTDNPQQAKARLVYIPDTDPAPPTQTGRGLLQDIAIKKNTPLDDAVLDLADRLGLQPHLDKRFEQMSTGTRRKVYLTAAALGNPAVIIADGPSNGLDTQARIALAEQFRHWSQDRVVLFASHDRALVKACDARPIHVSTLQ